METNNPWYALLVSFIKFPEEGDEHQANCSFKIRKTRTRRVEIVCIESCSLSMPLMSKSHGLSNRQSFDEQLSTLVEAILHPPVGYQFLTLAGVGAYLLGKAAPNMSHWLEYLAMKGINFRFVDFDNASSDTANGIVSKLRSTSIIGVLIKLVEEFTYRATIPSLEPQQLQEFIWQLYQQAAACVIECVTDSRSGELAVQRLKALPSHFVQSVRQCGIHTNDTQFLDNLLESLRAFSLAYGALALVIARKLEPDKKGEYTHSQNDFSLLEGRDLITFSTASRYSGLSERWLRELGKRGSLVVVGQGHNKKLTSRSVIEYFGPQKTKK